MNATILSNFISLQTHVSAPYEPMGGTKRPPRPKPWKETPCLDRKQLHRRRDRQGIETDFRSVSVWQRGVWGLCLSSSGNRYERCACTRLQMRTIVTAIATETKRKYDRDISMSRVSVSSWNGSEENKTVIKGKTLWNVYGTLKHAPFTPSFNDV